MIFFENHNTCIGKYGDDLTKRMEVVGISPKLNRASIYHINVSTYQRINKLSYYRITSLWVVVLVGVRSLRK